MPGTAAEAMTVGRGVRFSAEYTPTQIEGELTSSVDDAIGCSKVIEQLGRRVRVVWDDCVAAVSRSAGVTSSRSTRVDAPETLRIRPVRSNASLNVMEPRVKKLALRAHSTVSKRAPVRHARIAQTCSENRASQLCAPRDRKYVDWTDTEGFGARRNAVGQLGNEHLTQFLVGACAGEGGHCENRVSRVSSCAA